jgi:hypothetical protein
LQKLLQNFAKIIAKSEALKSNQEKTERIKSREDEKN